MSKKLNGLYVISDDLLTPKNSIKDQIEQSLKGGAKIVQLRDKTSSDEEIETLIQDLENLCNKYNAVFVLNDRVELAIKLKCSGLHVGKSDYHKIEYIRKEFNGVLGVSCYGDLENAKKMENLGVDYVAFGSFFPSPTKPQSDVVDINVIAKAKDYINIPICAIGGINTKNYKELTMQNVDMIAVISDIWKSENIKNKCEEFLGGFN